MITEKGNVKSSVKIDEKVQDELNKTTRILGIVYIALGAVLTAGGLVVCFLEAYWNSDDFIGTLLLMVGLILLVGGICVNVLCKNLRKTVTKFARVEEVEFYDNYLIERVYTDGEHTSTNKVYFKWIVKIKETQNYLFLYPSRAAAIAVNKSLPPNELNVVRALLKGVPQPVPAQSVQNTDADKPAEPFADMTDNKEE